jgi:hypothetical protein
MRQSLEKWMSPEGRERYAKEFDNFYRLRAAPTNPGEF